MGFIQTHLIAKNLVWSQVALNEREGLVYAMNSNHEGKFHSFLTHSPKGALGTRVSSTKGKGKRGGRHTHIKLINSWGGSVGVSSTTTCVALLYYTGGPESKPVPMLGS